MSAPTYPVKDIIIRSKLHKYPIGMKITACVNEYINWGNEDWVEGTITNFCYVDGKQAYDVVDMSGATIYNILEELIESE